MDQPDNLIRHVFPLVQAVRADHAGGGAARVDPPPRRHPRVRHLRLLRVPDPPDPPARGLRQDEEGDPRGSQDRSDGKDC